MDTAGIAVSLLRAYQARIVSVHIFDTFKAWLGFFVSVSYMNQRQIHFWRNILRAELFGHNDEKYPWECLGEAFKPKNVKLAIKHSGGNSRLWGPTSASGTGALKRRDTSNFFRFISN